MRFEALSLAFALAGWASQPQIPSVASCLNRHESAADWALMSPAPPAAFQILAGLARDQFGTAYARSSRTYWIKNSDGRMRFFFNDKAPAEIYTFVPDGASWERAANPDEGW